MASAEQRSDGVLPAALCRQQGPKALRELVDAGLLIADGKDYRIHDYAKHQTPRGDIQNKATRGAHTRWHVNAERYDPECHHCQHDAGNGAAWIDTPTQSEGPPPW